MKPVHRLGNGSRAIALAAIGSIGLWLAPPTADAGDTAAGKKVYETNCTACHGPTGMGDGPVGAVLNPRPRDFSAGDFKFDTNKDGKTGTDTDLADVIRNGGAAYGGSALMAPWATLSEQDVENLIAYIRSLKK